MDTEEMAAAMSREYAMKMFQYGIRLKSGFIHQVT
jgi:hypothetical protein